MDKYRKGDLLQIQTKDSEVVTGRFFNMTEDMSKISLYNVNETHKGENNDGIFHYYDSEIRKIDKLQDTATVNMLKISEKDYEDIVKVSKKYLLINQVDNSFQEAIKDLNNYSYIGLSTDGTSMGRKCKVPFLVLSTPHKIYIFDTQVMQYHAFDAGLRKLLEGTTPKKIVHDSRKISDCLYHKHGVKLNSVFDTQVGDIIISKNKSGKFPNTVRSLSECLTAYLGLHNAIEEKLDIVQCTARPLSTNIKETLAKNIAFLHRLSEIIHDEMMLPFVRGVEFYVEHLRSCDDFKAWELCGKHQQIPKDFKSAIEY